MLLSVLIDAEAFEGKIPAWPIVRFDWSWQKQRRFHAQICQAVLHDRELDGNDPSHLDCSTKGNFSVALTEMQVPHAKFSAGHVNWQEYLAATAKVFNVTIASMFWPTRDCSCSFSTNFLLNFSCGTSGVNVLRLRRLSNNSFQCGSTNELTFTIIPYFEYFSRRSASKDTRVDQTRKADMGNVSRRAKNSFKIPDGFGSMKVIAVSMQPNRRVFVEPAYALG